MCSGLCIIAKCVDSLTTFADRQTPSSRSFELPQRGLVASMHSVGLISAHASARTQPRMSGTARTTEQQERRGLTEDVVPVFLAQFLDALCGNRHIVPLDVHKALHRAHNATARQVHQQAMHQKRPKFGVRLTTSLKTDS